MGSRRTTLWRCSSVHSRIAPDTRALERCWVELARGGVFESKGSAAALEEKEMSRQRRFPADWDEARVRRVLEHCEGQSDEGAAAEDEAAAAEDEAAAAEDEAEVEATTDVLMEVPVDLVPTVRRLIDQYERSA
jgi:hypothetical protein